MNSLHFCLFGVFCSKACVTFQCNPLSCRYTEFLIITLWRHVPLECYLGFEWVFCRLQQYWPQMLCQLLQYLYAITHIKEHWCCDSFEISEPHNLLCFHYLLSWCWCMVINFVEMLETPIFMNISLLGSWGCFAHCLLVGAGLYWKGFKGKPGKSRSWGEV